MAGFELQGHRGARGLFPENTLEGFAATLALGVDAIECDVAVTADDVPVMFHDVRLNPDLVRGPGGEWLSGEGPTIRSLTRADLRGYDVGRIRPGSRTARAHPDQRPVDGARIPSLADMFAAVGPTSVRVDAELKTLPEDPDATVTPERMADRVIETWQEAGRPPLDVRSFDWRALRYLRHVCPDLPLTWLTSAATAADPALWWGLECASAAIPGLIAAEVQGAPWQACWAPAHETLTQDDVLEARRCGIRVVPWTVNEVADMARLIKWGVDGLCTDRPDRARTVMREAGLLLPAPRQATSRRG